MKRVIIISLMLCLLLCGCRQNQNEYVHNSELTTFSYTQHCIEFADQKVSICETKDQDKQAIKTVDDIVAIARQCCLTSNTETMVEYDPLTGVYCVTFIPFFEIDGNNLYYTDSSTVHVYINAEGIVLMTILIG